MVHHKNASCRKSQKEQNQDSPAETYSLVKQQQKNTGHHREKTAVRCFLIGGRGARIPSVIFLQSMLYSVEKNPAFFQDRHTKKKYRQNAEDKKKPEYNLVETAFFPDGQYRKQQRKNQYPRKVKTKIPGDGKNLKQREEKTHSG
nr:hypothetical protein [uncultured Blautia sp.]